MATTPDLPPGARFRMWALFVVTAIVGVAMYSAFERSEGLYVAAGVLIILVYLLAGVRLTLLRDQQSIGELVATTVVDIEEPFWVLVDGRQGTVLHVTDFGTSELAHSRSVLLGQRFTDLTLDVSPDAQVTIVELLRFGCVSQPWSGTLKIKSENGQTLELAARTLYLENPEARKAGLVAIGPVV